MSPKGCANIRRASGWQTERPAIGNLQIISTAQQLRSRTDTHPSEAAVQNIDGLSILIVEEEYLLALSLVDALTDTGCKIVGPVGPLDDALDVVHANWIDAAILDVNLHGEKSYPVMDTLAQLGTPFVIYRGNPLSTLPVRYSDRPALIKPTDPATIITTLARAMANPDPTPPWPRHALEAPGAGSQNRIFSDS
jgi:hypothetical protein